MNGGHFDPVLEQIDSHGFTQRIHPKFGGTVDIAFFIDLLACDGSNDQDMTFLGSNHFFGNGLGDV
jgi:hypothetical protein